MSGKKPMTLVQNFLKKELPLFPSDNFGTPAPAHIFNKFSFELLGDGKLSANIMEIRRDISKLDNFLPENTSREIKEEFIKSIDIILNSDKRSFIKGKFSSFFLLNKELINKSDPSDHGYGSALKMIFNTEQLNAIQQFLNRILDSSLSDDVVSKFITSLIEISKISVFHDLPPTESKGTQFGNLIYEILKTGMDKMELETKTAERINSLQKLSTFLTFTVALGNIYDSSLSNFVKPEEIKPYEVLGIFCYTGYPPGNPRSVLTKLAQASLKDAISRGYQGSLKIFKDQFDGVNDEKQIESVILKKLSGESARDFVQFVTKNWSIGLDNIFKELVPQAYYSGAFRSLSGKIGFAGPVKGTGEKRIMFEASFLEVLVYFFSNEGDTFETFINNCYEKIGLILGRPRNFSETNYSTLERLSSRYSDVEEALEKSQEFLRQRLVKSGLAREFSDGFTVMVQN